MRRTAWENYADAHLAFKNTVANAQAAGIKRDVFFARVRNYGSSLDAALSSTYIPTEVFHNLINTFKKNLPTWHRYWAIRKKALNLDSFHIYDVKAPLTENPPKVSYETAVSWIAEGMLPLGQRVRLHFAPRCFRRSLGRCLPQQRQTNGSLLLRRTRHAPLHHDEL